MSFRIEGVHFAHGMKTVLHDLTLDIVAGETLAVLGPSGIGKSTFLNLLGLLWEPQSATWRGRIEYADRDGQRHSYSELTDNEFVRIRRNEFGFALQSSYLLPNFTCAENIAMPLGIQGIDHQERVARAKRLIRDADPTGELSARQDALGREISGGEKQRVSVLRAVVHDPQVIFADEPFSALDEANKRSILEVLVRWKREEFSDQKTVPIPRTLVLVCHEPLTAKNYADRILSLERDHQYRLSSSSDFSI